ncbi:MAG TPA: adenylosuccinate synthase [Polyangiales bacterium]|nr:adenylosuccinate synthase [Polyangiales bacterium]
MGAVVVVGAQWGDEGKGKIVDIYSQNADMIVRYAGGANAGHTLVVEGEKIVFRLIPSGALNPKTQCVLGQGTVIDPNILLTEFKALQKRGLYSAERFIVSDRAHVVLPHHMQIDGLREAGIGSIGTTKKGIGPAYEDKAARRGIRIGDLLDADKLRAKLAQNIEAWKPVIVALGGTVPDLGEWVEDYLGYGRELSAHIGDAARPVQRAIVSGKRVLLEGAQGALLDVDSGTYPFVTSSSTTAGGACTGAGIGPTDIRAVLGITKAYTTRVGSGPFPTEIHGEGGERLREAGLEFGAVTGRPRRCGWLDIPALRHAARINGLSGLAITKVDVLTGMEDIQLCVAYERNGVRLEDPPYDQLEDVTPIYETFPGWSESISGCSALHELPRNALRYICAIEDLVGCKAWLVSVGPDRKQTIQFSDPWATRF